MVVSIDHHRLVSLQDVFVIVMVDQPTSKAVGQRSGGRRKDLAGEEKILAGKTVRCLSYDSDTYHNMALSNFKFKEYLEKPRGSKYGTPR